ncbi:hypothetical protein IWZ00DRAFT_485337 [Phyllosticta capitalensis]
MTARSVFHSIPVRATQPTPHTILEPNHQDLSTIMDPSGFASGRGRVPKDFNLLSIRHAGDVNIHAALAADDRPKAMDLAKEVLMDPELDHLTRFKWETFLSTLCEHGHEHHVEQAELACKAMEELVESRIENPKKEDVDSVKTMRNLLEEIKQDLRGRGLLDAEKADNQAGEETMKQTPEYVEVPAKAPKETPKELQRSEMAAWSGKQGKLARLFQKL